MTRWPEILGGACWIVLALILIGVRLSYVPSFRRRTFCRVGKHRESAQRRFTSLYAILDCRDCGHQMKYREITADDMPRRQS